MSEGRHHIYVVDDDEPYRRSIVRLLKSAGYVAASFSSAQRFLDSVAVNCVTGVLILDLRMPGMDGFDLQKRMNELKSRLEIIFITADAHSGDQEHALGSGAIAFFRKPFNDQLLIEKINQALSIFATGQDPAAKKQQGAPAPTLRKD